MTETCAAEKIGDAIADALGDLGPVRSSSGWFCLRSRSGN
jgi:hypothetical protein